MMAKVKNSRIQESRVADDSRDSEIRALLNMEYLDPLHIPEDKIPEGKEYYWVRKSVNGEEDPHRMIEMARKGWTPVPADRHPEMQLQDFFGTLAHMKGYIVHKGLILCERPKEYGDIERRKREKRNYEILTSMPGTENFMGEPTIPVKSTHETYTSKGIRVKDGGFGE